jgi:hypothetical protein
MSRVQVKTAKKQLANKNIVNMFNQMLGTEDADPDVIKPKYNIIKSKVKSIAKLLLSATNDVLRKSFEEENDCFVDIEKFAAKLNAIEFIDLPENPTREENFDICKHYIENKSNNSIKIIILMCKNLIPFTDKLATDSTFDDSIISRIPGLSFQPFPFSALNIKSLFAMKQTTEHIKKYIFTLLKILLDMSRDIYKTLTSPDVNIKEFSQTIISSIAQVKKQIPRCDKAFRKIEESVSLLENNFDGYYKDFIQSQNPNTIIESFVIDVSTSSKSDIQTTAQFRKIVNYYRKMTNGKIQDPKIMKVFDMLNSSFDSMNVPEEVVPAEEKDKEQVKPADDQDKEQEQESDEQTLNNASDVCDDISGNKDKETGKENKSEKVEVLKKNKRGRKPNKK